MGAGLPSNTKTSHPNGEQIAKSSVIGSTNSPVKPVAGAAIAIGVEAANVITASVQLKDSDGVALATRAAVSAYLTDAITAANAYRLAATAPTGGIAAGTNGRVIPEITGKRATLVSDAQGRVDVAITDTTTPTFYLVLVMPDGSLVTSGAITFA